MAFSRQNLSRLTGTEQPADTAAGAGARSAAGTLLVDLCTKSAPNLACKEKVK